MSNRRTFIKQSSVLTAGAFLHPRPLMAASDQINIGAIGLNGMGWADLQSALKVPGVNVVASCDVDEMYWTTE